MPKTSKTTASESFESRGTKVIEDLARTPWGPRLQGRGSRRLFVGLPDDHCQYPHMGYVIKGKLRFTFADGREETYEAGDAYFAPPGLRPTLCRVRGRGVRPERRAEADARGGRAEHGGCRGVSVTWSGPLRRPDRPSSSRCRRSRASCRRVLDLTLCVRVLDGGDRGRERGLHRVDGSLGVSSLHSARPRELETSPTVVVDGVNLGLDGRGELRRRRSLMSSPDSVSGARRALEVVRERVGRCLAHRPQRFGARPP